MFKTPGIRIYLTCTVLVLIFLSAPMAASAESSLVVKIRPFREKNIDPTKEYKYQLLELILNKTRETEGPFKIEIAGREMIKQSRVIEMVDQGVLSLIMTMTSREREKALLPVRIPVYKGLFGYRIFIINKRDQERFARLNSRQELAALWAGLGHDWPDLEILKYNGFNTVGGSSYRGLFAMLQEDRFDYFPRAVTEPWREVEEEKDRNIMVEPTLVLHYYAPAYIFVSRTDEGLAERVRKGFEAAIEDGSFEKLFRNHWWIRENLRRADLKNRKMYRLDNPLLTPRTPLDRANLWYRP